MAAVLFQWCNSHCWRRDNKSWGCEIHCTSTSGCFWSPFPSHK